MEPDIWAVAEQTKYPVDAFIFVQRGLDYAVRKVHGSNGPYLEHGDEQSHHVSGPQLCEGLRDFAIEQYGQMARTVLKHWHILATQDFGHIVFAMINSGVMKKTDDDTLKDFFDVFLFADVFSQPLTLSTQDSLMPRDSSQS